MKKCNARKKAKRRVIIAKKKALIREKKRSTNKKSKKWTSTNNLKSSLCYSRGWFFYLFLYWNKTKILYNIDPIINIKKIINLWKLTKFLLRGQTLQENV